MKAQRIAAFLLMYPSCAGAQLIDEPVRRGDWKLVDEIISRTSADERRLESATEGYQNPYAGLMNYVHTGYLYGNAMTAVRKLHEAGFNINATRGYALYQAARNDCAGKMLQRMIKYGADVNAELYPLAGAVIGNRPENVKILLENKADPNRESLMPQSITRAEEKPWHLLSFAANRGFLDVAKVLIRGKANLNARNSVTGRTALHEAVAADQPLLVKLLLASRADSKIKDKAGLTALQFAKKFNMAKSLAVFRSFNFSDSSHP